MPSIGPQLPPHLQKRKRTPEDDDTPQTAPPPKATRRANDDEIALDSDSSDDGYGPSAPKAPLTSKPTIGPSLPPSATTRPSQPIGPSMPPSSASNNNDPSSPVPRTGGPSAPRRVLGPAPPPAPLSERPPRSPSPPRNSESDSDSDDDYGPALPSTNPSSTSTTAHPSRRAPSPPPTAPKRDDWMLAPPTAPSSRTAPDPTKLKSRKFASSSKAPSSGSGISSIWTETPEEKARRLANAVLGREDPSTAPASVTAGGPGKGGMVSFKRTAADEEKIRAYAEQSRGRSLVEEFAEAKKEGKREKEGGGGRKKDGKGGEDDDDDDPSKRAFDWEKDMKVGGQISNSQRQQLLNRAANFGGRFQKGSFL